MQFAETFTLHFKNEWKVIVVGWKKHHTHTHTHFGVQVATTRNDLCIRPALNTHKLCVIQPNIDSLPLTVFVVSFCPHMGIWRHWNIRAFTFRCVMSKIEEQSLQYVWIKLSCKWHPLLSARKQHNCNFNVIWPSANFALNVCSWFHQMNLIQAEDIFIKSVMFAIEMVKLVFVNSIN